MCTLQCLHMNFLKVVKVAAMTKLISVTITDVPVGEKCDQAGESELTPAQTMENNH